MKMNVFGTIEWFEDQLNLSRKLFLQQDSDLLRNIQISITWI